MGRRRTTQENSETPDGGLTPQQLACVDVLVSGKTITEAAASVGVGRPALSGWLNHDCHFQAALNARRQEAFDAMVDTLRGLLPRALAVIKAQLEGDNPLPAALAILKSCGLATGLGRPTGPATVEEAEQAQRQREVERTLTAVSVEDVALAQRKRGQDRLMAELLL